MNKHTIERFWEKVEKTDNCWLWKASKRNKGYGAFIWADKNGKIIQGRAHRFSWELHFGEIPIGLCVLHKCDIPACVNPKHLFLGTKADNNNDICLKGRHVSGGTHCGINGKWKKGKDHHNYKYPKELIILLKKDREQGHSFSFLSRKYSIPIGYIFRIITGKARKDAR